MKGILEFDLPDESSDHAAALRSGRLWAALENIAEAIRRHEKYSESTPEAKDALIRDIRETAHGAIAGLY